MSRSAASLLVVDDDPSVVEFLCEMLGERGYRVRGLTEARAALHAAQEASWDLLIADVEMPELRGVDLVAALQRLASAPPVLLMTAFGNIELAVQAVRSGACDFLAKPFRIEALYEAVERALRERLVRRELVRLRPVTPPVAGSLVARSAAMLRIVDLAQRAARTVATVLLTGESGTGKGRLARYLHEQSAERRGPFVAVSCAELPANLIESELFGVRKGAFTDARQSRDGLFVAASGGTLFLDEIAELPLEAQAKLLTVLESGQVRPLGTTVARPVKVRIVAATNQPIESLVREGRFRADLFYRLNVIRIDLPPLRQRCEDLPALVDHLLGRVCERHGRALLGISVAAIRKLEAHDWPGNIRELSNVIERAVALTEHEVLVPEDFDLCMEMNLEQMLSDGARSGTPLAEIERAYIRAVLKENGGNKAAAARALSIDRSTLYRKM